jgi:CRP-like cAMP-binding protein
LKRLEPIHYPAKEIIFNELDDVNEVIFVEKGLYDVGYEINKQIVLKMRQLNKTVIGTFEVCFDKRILFIFKTFTECKGYIIRKQKFRDLEVEHRELYHSLKQNSLFNYIQNIRRPLLQHKQEDIEFYDKRADYQQVLALRNYNENEIKDLVDLETQKMMHRGSEEIMCMHDIEKTITKYERYLAKVLKNYDQAQDVYEYSVDANKNLQAENDRLRKLAEEKGINVEELLKQNEDIDPSTISHKSLVRDQSQASAFSKKD